MICIIIIIIRVSGNLKQIVEVLLPRFGSELEPRGWRVISRLQGQRSKHHRIRDSFRQSQIPCAKVSNKFITKKHTKTSFGSDPNKTADALPASSTNFPTQQTPRFLERGQQAGPACTRLAQAVKTLELIAAAF